MIIGYPLLRASGHASYMVRILSTWRQYYWDHSLIQLIAILLEILLLAYLILPTQDTRTKILK